MKITKSIKEYVPLSITFETQLEEDSFLAIIDKVDSCISNANSPISLSPPQKKLLISISDWFTDNRGLRTKQEDLK